MADPLTGQFSETKWKHIHVGQVVKIRSDEYFPADLVLLTSSAPKGIAYIETKNLDGETNLKHKQGVKEIVDHLKSSSENSTAERYSERTDIKQK